MTASIDLKPVLGFLNGLERNNNKAWFEAHRERYGRAHAAFEAYVEELIAALAPPTTWPASRPRSVCSA
jgi:hypothetical protein